MGETYQCSMCHNVYVKTRTDDEAMEEAEELWGDALDAGSSVVCDDCFEYMTGKLSPAEWALAVGKEGSG